ncbi:MAG: tRNA guanosine(34) transglycosylase Tgt [Treponema sp.]|jgi:queuine tRNA-ribosyltransferase|nr:tRNA guanosine(34) transglycosylase Tgt [Treponema sp.]
MSGLFRVLEKDGRARSGVLALSHGNVRTPVFMPVGTNGCVKALANEDLASIGFEIILANTYHLYLRPGVDVVKNAGSLHEFTGWNGNYLTDSGGFQVFSLAPFRKIQEEGVAFRSHIDGSHHLLSPEKIVEIQAVLGSDIQMQLDVCTPWGIDEKKARAALEITSRWLLRAKDAWLSEGERGYKGRLFAIMQGNFYRNLRAESAEIITRADTPGVAIGGLSVGESEELFFEYLAYSASLLPEEKPRYVMGIGTPRYILEAIENGIDMFDCVFPTRNARNGQFFTRYGPLSIKKAEYRLDGEPVDRFCSCKVCKTYSRSYLRHLFKTKEILCSMLASYHNLYFLYTLVSGARNAIAKGCFASFKKAFLADYENSSLLQAG